MKLEAPTTLAEKQKRLEALSLMMDKKNKTENSLIRLGSRVGKPIPSIKTGLPSLDYEVLGCGGVPRGRILEIYGPESAGKTTTTLHIIGQAQQAGELTAFVDVEHALDPTYAKYLGVDVSNLLVNQPNSGEQALDMVQKLVESQCVSLIVVDSVAALTPEAELAGEIGDSHVGLQGRMMSQALRILTGAASRNDVSIIFINQIREKIGVMYGSNETTTGGRALRHYSTIRLDVRRRGEIKDGTTLVGHQLELTAKKNKAATPFKSTILDLYYPGTIYTPGLDQIGDTISYAAKKGVFEMSGSWYSLGPDRLANGLENLKTVLKDNDKALKAVKAKLETILKSEVKGSI